MTATPAETWEVCRGTDRQRRMTSGDGGGTSDGLDEALKSLPGYHHPAPQPEPRKLTSADEFVGEGAGDAKQLGCFLDRQRETVCSTMVPPEGSGSLEIGPWPY